MSIIEKIINFFKKLFGIAEPDIEFDENTKLTTIITSACAGNSEITHLYYNSIQDAQANMHLDTQKLISYPGVSKMRPFWDIRYTKPMTEYQSQTDHSLYTGLDSRAGINNITFGTRASQVDATGCVAQSKCHDGAITAGTILNLHDAPEQSIEYGGLVATYAYILGNTILTSPWQNSGNMMVQSQFNKPLYRDFGGAGNALGGSISFNFFLKNDKLHKYINIVIAVYSYGQGWTQEQNEIHFDTTSRTIHIASAVNPGTKWTTKSPQSKSTELIHSSTDTTIDNGLWEDFYRVNITYQNMLNILKEIKHNPPTAAQGQEFGLSPEDWRITTAMVQHEIEESGTKSALSGSFRGFEVYSSALPL